MSWLVILEEYVSQLGIHSLMEFDPCLLIPEQRIRNLCAENKCGNYGKNYTCPPDTGSLEDMKVRLAPFKKGLLLRYSQTVDAVSDRKGVELTKVSFHKKVLEVEWLMEREGISGIWGMIGGSCGLCDKCKSELREPCLYPSDARLSLESIGVDVQGLLGELGLDNRFYPDRVTWTGCVLF